MYEYKIKEITHFVDGDTFDCMIDLGFDILHKIRVRMYGMNTPESRTRDLDEKKRGLESKDKLIELLSPQCEYDHLDFKLILKTKEKGKFGRWLGIVLKRYKDDTEIDVNQLMIEEGYAVPYFGGKR
jgi:micrococcal nuclease